MTGRAPVLLEQLMGETAVAETVMRDVMVVVKVQSSSTVRRQEKRF
jgi:hypothetical protein